MKKLFLLLFAALFSVNIIAQQDVTKFLGIPVDGSQSSMLNKLKAKGFRKVVGTDPEVLEGEFNGSEVYVSVATNKDKVYRVFLWDKIKRNESDIKIRFNNLVSQFYRNQKYMKFSEEDYTIPENEDIL